MSAHPDDVFQGTAWTLQKYGNGGNAAIMPYSRRHLLDPDTGEILCGAQQGLHFGHSNSGRCKRCYKIAIRRLAEVSA